MVQAQIIEFVRDDEPRGDVRAGELVDRYIMALEQAAEAELPPSDATPSELLAALG